jgi:hypothetical protein
LGGSRCHSIVRRSNRLLVADHPKFVESSVKIYVKRQDMRRSLYGQSLQRGKA